MFNEDLQEVCVHFPAVWEQVQGQREVSFFVSFIDKPIVTFSNRFDSFSVGQQLTMFIQKTIPHRRYQELLKVTQHFNWLNAGDLQMKLVDL